MSNRKHSRLSRSQRRRRPFGVSRRRKQLQLGFETLEDRRVMSADSPLEYGPYLLAPDASRPSTFTSYSSATPEGQQYILLQELQWYDSVNGGSGTGLATHALPDDLYFEDQWHLLNVGQEAGITNENIQDIFGVPGEDINVVPAWEAGYTGAGVLVAVIDSGTEFTHPDLAGNIDPFFQYDAIDNDSDASPQLIDIPLLFEENPLIVNAHGTAVAGLIGAEANDIGGIGVAPGVQLVPIRLIDDGATLLSTVEAFRFGDGTIDITNNSWGPDNPLGSRTLNAPTIFELIELRDSAVLGRDGLGTIHVFSAGNGADDTLDPITGARNGLGSSNYNGWVNSRYTIGVTGVDHDGHYNNLDGTVTAYPETGTSVLVAAPTGSFTQPVGDDPANGSGLLTTDTTNDTGFNRVDPQDPFDFPDFDSFEDEAYTSRFNGTSAAAPLVSGVIALMLEANPNLSMRDVQEILVRSSRQNAEFDRQQNGFDKATGRSYQSTWIINQVPLFHDPDVYDPLIPNIVQFYAPILDPTDFDVSAPGLNTHFTPTPQVLTNGAGYTISQGRGTNRDQTGYAHGVVDAELAVSLAEQWTLKGETLPAELSFTTTSDTPIPTFGVNTSIPGAFVVDPGGDGLIIPGSLGAAGDWQGYYQEYYADDPDFSQFDAPITRGSPLELTVPEIEGQDIVIEHVEVRLDISGGTADALDNLRVVLVSPSGTHSELNHYFVDPSFAVIDEHQSGGFFDSVINPETGEFVSRLQPNGLNGVADEEEDRLDPTPPAAGDLVFTFSSNRAWGERSGDAILFDPTTNEPFNTLPGGGGNIFAEDGFISDVDVLTQGWQLHFENYGTTDLNLDSVEFVWHGRPVSASTQRVQGLIGIDDNRDDLFNYSRVNTVVDNIDFGLFYVDDPTVDRLGEVINFVDTNHESMAADITVLAFRDVNANGEIDATDQLVDQFVTGADGNYYFDLVPDNYIIAIDDDSLGTLTPLDDSLTPGGFLLDYQAQWAINTDYFQVWDYDSNLDVAIDPLTEAPIPFLDGSNNPITYDVSNINFLLDPGPPPAPEVVFNGQVIADLNGDGVFNGVDTAAPGILVFGDVNRNNLFDAGEVFTSTDLDGNYSLTVPTTETTSLQVGVLAPVDWVFSSPADGLLEFIGVGPGEIQNNVDFALIPPASGPGTPGSAQPGSILGFVFNDDNEDGVRQVSEAGVPNIEVYIDNNNSGANDAGDTVVTTNSNGAYIFTEVPVGTHNLRIDFSDFATFQQTFPIFNGPNVVTITGENTVSGVQFGIDNTAVLDFGDLPEQYGTLFNPAVHNNLTGGARHTKGIFYLGNSVDSELNGIPTADALGDDNTGLMDEDGIFIDPLVAGQDGSLEAIASVNGGWLQGWMDFNGDGDFDDVIGGVSERIFADKLLIAGSNFLTFDVPDVIDADTVYARFRFGEVGLGLLGLGLVGEVEDYVVEKAAPAPLMHGPDFNQDGDVDGSDFLALQQGLGIQTNALPGNGDANNDGAVSMEDLQIWMQGFGGGTVALAAVQSSDDESDESSTPPLAAAISSELDSENSTFAASDSDSEVLSTQTTYGVRVIQPYFPEELPSSVVDSSEATYEFTARELASIAGRVAARSGYRAPSSEPNANEQVVAETVVEGAGESSQVLDAAFASRQQRIEQLGSDTQADEHEAIAAALGEEVDWIFG